MKVNVRRVSDPEKIGKFIDDPNGDWWTWKEVCDRCGNLVWDDLDYLTWYADDSIPKTDTKDYCLNCAHELLDEKLKENNE